MSDDKSKNPPNSKDDHFTPFDPRRRKSFDAEVERDSRQNFVCEVHKTNTDKSKNPPNSKDVSRRDFIRKGGKAVYVVPLVLGAVTAAERPAHAGTPSTDPPTLEKD